MTMLQTLKDNPRLTEFGIICIVAITVTALGWWSSELIPVIDSGKSFVPQPVDYLRTFVLAACSSFIVNYLYKTVDKTFVFCKVWCEFLALLLLAFPQKTEQNYTYSSWNLVKRQGYLFGVFYQLVYLLFHIWDLWALENDEADMNKFVRPEDLENHISEEVRKKSTLSNCINIRRNSSTLKKVIYSTEYQPCQRIDEIAQTPTPETESLLKKPDVIVVDYHTDSMDFLSNSQSSLSHARNNSTQEDMMASYGSMVTTVISRGSSPNEAGGVDIRWITENSIWIIVTMLHEIGLALLLSITFIYVPDLDDSLFTDIEIYFYNKINLFCMEIVSPLFILCSLLQILLHSANDATQRTKTFACFSGVSVLLFILGIFLT